MLAFYSVRGCELRKGCGTCKKVLSRYTRDLGEGEGEGGSGHSQRKRNARVSRAEATHKREEHTVEQIFKRRRENGAMN